MDEKKRNREEFSYNLNTGEFLYTPYRAWREGEHKVRIEVPDLAGNIAEAEFSFYFSQRYQTIEPVKIFPNPCRLGQNITFSYPYSQPNIPVIIQVFNVSGELVKEFKTQTTSDPENDRVTWNLQQKNKSISSGIYLVTITFQDPHGKEQYTTKFAFIK